MPLSQSLIPPDFWIIMPLQKEVQSDAMWYRIVLAIGTVAIPLFGVIVKQQLPDSIDYMSHRLIMSLVWSTLLVLSFTSSFFKKHFIVITCWLLFILNQWAVWIVYINNFALDYTIGLFLTFCTLNISLRHPRLYYPFLAMAMISWIGSSWMAPNPELDFSSTLFFVSILGIVFMLITNIINNAEKKLSDLNQTLEKKVQERTLEVENHAKKLIAKNAELEQFAYIASHDLKSPLRNIGGFIQLIQRR
jgi:signal transduction histidine kinase